MICHAKPSPMNPFEKIDVDKNSTAQGHNGHDQDIIPPFQYWDKVCTGHGHKSRCEDVLKNYTGKNWDERGQAIWNNKCVVKCAQTVELVSETGWLDDPEDETRQYNIITTKIVDKMDNEISCGRTTEKTEYRYKECSRTVRVFDEWSNWEVDLEDDTQEYRTRNAYAVDSQNSEKICVGPIVQTETRDREIQYESCIYTTDIYGEWSNWAVDPSDDTREFRDRIVTKVDSEYTDILCGEPTREVEYRDIEEEGDVLGTTDKAEVLGTSIIYANTAGDVNSNLLLAGYLMMILTGISFIFLGKQYLQR